MTAAAPLEGILLDVSRLIWRRWSGRLPTGIDRVCLAYLDHFRNHARAVVQFRRFRWILGRRSSRRLFELLLGEGPGVRARLILCLARSLIGRGRAVAGQFYFNVGHTGLDSGSLGSWIRSHGLRPVFLIHDLIPITHPQYCRDGEDQRHRRRISRAVRHAAALIVNSASTRAELAAFAAANRWTLPPTAVAWLGPGRSELRGQPRRAPADPPYFLLIGTIEARKNHMLILRAWAALLDRLGEATPKLIIVGQRGWKAEEAIACLDAPGMLANHVEELGRCTDERLEELIIGARAVLMPSHAEGFGLPVAEALRLGTPVIASDLAVFREIAGDNPDYLPPDDLDGWTEMIERHCAAPAECAPAISFRCPTWAGHFQIVERFLESLA